MNRTQIVPDSIRGLQMRLTHPVGCIPDWSFFVGMVLRAAAGEITLGDENSGFEWHAPLPFVTALVDCTARYLLVP